MIRIALLTIGIAFAIHSSAFPHGLPVEVIVLDNGQLDPFRNLSGVPVIGTGEFININGFISADTPGIGVTNQANGVAVNTDFMLEVTGDLLYWDGASVKPTKAVIEIFSPDLRTSYRISADSPEQTGMFWGTYTGERFWEADGLYVLHPQNALTGLYGIGIRIASPDYRSSEAFVLPIIYGFMLPDVQLMGLEAFRNAFQRPLPGDFDGNGQLDANDIDALSRELVNAIQEDQFDVNADGFIDLQDHRFWVDSLKRTFLGDANLDGEFNSSDLITVFQAAEYEDAIAANSGWSTGDWTGDLEFDSTDIIAAFQAGGYDTGPRTEAVAVPEPCLVPLLVLYMTLQLRFIQRRRIAKPSKP